MVLLLVLQIRQVLVVFFELIGVLSRYVLLLPRSRLLHMKLSFRLFCMLLNFLCSFIRVFFGLCVIVLIWFGFLLIYLWWFLGSYMLPGLIVVISFFSINFLISHIYRDGNIVADALSKCVVSSQCLYMSFHLPNYFNSLQIIKIVLGFINFVRDGTFCFLLLL